MEEHIHVYLFVIRSIRKHREEFPMLYREYMIDSAKQRARRKHRNAPKAAWIHVSDAAYAEYVALVQKYLTCDTVPDTPRPVTLFTHNMGHITAYYKDGEWEYTSIAGNPRPVASIVMRWCEIPKKKEL